MLLEKLFEQITQRHPAVSEDEGHFITQRLKELEGLRQCESPLRSETGQAAGVGSSLDERQQALNYKKPSRASRES